MAVFETWIESDLQKMIVPRALPGNAFCMDSGANLIGVSVMDGGEPATLSGTVAGKVVRSDGTTVPVTGGTLSGNRASIILPQRAYEVPGPIAIAVTLTSGSTVTTIGAVTGYVVRSQTDSIIDPGTILPTIDTLINQIQTAIDSIPADYSQVIHSIAPSFSSSTAYSAGDMVWYPGEATNPGALYRFTSAHAAGEWTGTDATAAVFANELSALKSALTADGPNIFDINSVISGEYINNAGVITSRSGCYRTDYIPCEGGAVYSRYTGPSGSMNIYFYAAFYDDQKTFISRYQYGYTKLYTFPTNAKYVIFCTYDQSFAPTFTVIKSSSEISQYYPHTVIKTDALYGSFDDTLSESGKIADAKVVGDKFSQIVQKTGNLFDPNTVTTGYYIKSDGNLASDANSQYSDYIPVTGGNTYTNSPDSQLYIATYDSAKTFIERILVDGTNGNNTNTFNANVAFVRLSRYFVRFAGTTMFFEGASLPAQYTPQEIINPDMIISNDDTTIISIEKISNSKVVITQGIASHIFELKTDANANLNTWRLTSDTVAGHVIWNNIDIEGPIKERGVSDYMTGFHGDEQMTDLLFIVDGVPTNISDLVSGKCITLEAIVKSDVYFDKATSRANQVAFNRNKRIVFYKNTMEIHNVYKYVNTNGDIEIDIATGTGLYSASTDYISGYTGNSIGEYKSEVNYYNDKLLDDVTFFGNGFTIRMGVLYGKTDTYNGSVYYYPNQTRYKVYFFQQYANGSNFLTMTNGNRLISGYKVEYM